MRPDQWMPAAVELRRVVEPQRIFQSVAAGLLGRASYEGGVLSLHYFIDATMSVTYYVVARRWAALRAQPVVYGAAYGFMLYGDMNYIVVPLSAAGRGLKVPLRVTLSIVVHVLLIGIPIALFVRRAHSA